MKRLRGKIGQDAQRGISLVELMIAMTLGLILISGVAQIFSSSRITLNTQQALSRVQETGRFAVQFLKHDVRMAGYTGCPEGGLDGSNRIASIASSVPANNSRFIHGRRGEDWDSGADTIAVDQASDVLSIRHAGVQHSRLTDDKTTGASLQISDNNPGFTNGETVMLTNCKTADIFGITALANSGGHINMTHGADRNTTPPSLRHTYKAGSRLTRFVQNTYFIGTRSGADSPSLYRIDTGGNIRELVEGVERMRIQYGIAGSHGAVGKYQNAETVSDWRQVIAVRIALLTRSQPALHAAKARTYRLLDDTPLSFNDRRLRQVFSTTVALRNRTF